MRKTSSRRTILAASFLLPACLMTAVFAVCGLAPFGTRTLGVMDMAHQYLPFLYSLRDILSGKTDLLYLPSMCLGGNMLGVAAYYLTSPLNLLCCLFPREQMYSAVSLLYILRTGLCGLTMAVWCGGRRGYSLRCLLPAAAYAFSGYMVGYCFNYLWHDCVILLPVIALGLARLSEGRRPWLYILSLAGALFLNFYIGYILCLFSVLFFLWAFFAQPRQTRPAAGRTIAVFALASLAAGALAAVVLVPAVFALAGGKAEFSLSVLTLTPQFDLIGMLSKLYPGAFRYEEIMPDGLPQIFTGTVTVSLALLYAADRRIPLRQRLLTGTFVLLLALSFWLKGLDLIWHALNTPTWYNHRYSFVLCFLLAAAADAELAACEADGDRPRALWLPAVLTAAVSVLVFAGRTYPYATWANAAAAVCVSAAACALVFVLTRRQTAAPAAPRRRAAAAAALLLLIHLAELAAGAGISLTRLTIPASDSASYADYVSAKAEAFALIDTGGDLIRVESTTEFNQDRCEPLLFGYDGISHYGSTLPQDSLDLLERLGIDRYGDVWAAYGPGVTAAADTLLGIRYIAAPSLGKDYPVCAETDSYTVYENTDALPVGWTADAAVAQEPTGEDCFSYLNALYAAAAPEAGGTVFVPAASVDIVTEGFLPAQDGTYALAEGALSASLTFTVTTAAAGPLYMQVNLPERPGVVVSVNGSSAGYYGTSQTNGSLLLGEFGAGETVTVVLQAFSDLDMAFAAFATEDRAALSRCAACLQEGGCTLHKLSSSHFTGSFTTGDGDTLLVLTIPWDEAWQIRLDGSPVQPQRLPNGLTALPVTPGSHTLEMRYIPRGLAAGAVITAAAAVCCAAVWALQKKRRA